MRRTRCVLIAAAVLAIAAMPLVPLAVASAPDAVVVGAGAGVMPAQDLAKSVTVERQAVAPAPAADILAGSADVEVLERHAIAQLDGTVVAAARGHVSRPIESFGRRST